MERSTGALFISAACVVLWCIVLANADLPQLLSIQLFVGLSFGTILAISDWSIFRPVLNSGALVKATHCPKCKYELAGLGERGTCPECASTFEPQPAIGPRRVRVAWRIDRIWRLALVLILIFVCSPWIATFALAARYALIEPWSAAWRNANLRPLGMELACGLLGCFAPAVVLVTNLARWGPRWAFPLSVAAGVAGGTVGLILESRRNLETLLAWSKMTGTDSGIATVVLSCGAALLAWLLAASWSITRRERIPSRQD